ncbi:hypothetical protein [Paenibacillus sp. FSL H8-0537]|uniref:hypothetical protein n=1 Tax=Paenibacillus sp. FSL H8-0537 TaxID=2921399 RepID=UPI0031011F80
MKLKKSIVMLTSATLLMWSFPLTGFSSVSNVTKTIAPITQQTNTGNYYATFDQKTKDFLDTYTKSGVAKEFSEKDEKIIILHDNTEYLKSAYGLTNEYVSLLRRLVSDANQKNVLSKTPVSGSTLAMASNSTVSPNLHISDWKIYFNQNDIQQYLFVAASIGVPAFIIALEGVSVILGPAGPILTTVLTIAGYGGMSNLCYLIIQSKYNSQSGVYFGISWNGIFPNLSQGTW